MPIPGDNGRPRLERQQQEVRITEEAKHGGDIKSELRFNKQAPKQNTYLGKIG